jgi:hypothetical protein
MPSGQTDPAALHRSLLGRRSPLHHALILYMSATGMRIDWEDLRQGTLCTCEIAHVT